jgi:3-oxoadipate enol-lactonase
MPKVSVNGIELYYEVQGTGDPLLLIAGFASDHTYWSPVVPALASHFRVIAFDNRGAGQSSSLEASISVRQMAEDAAGLLDAAGLHDAIGVGPVHLAGHSMGGMIAQELALVHPEKVRSLLLISSCAQVDARGRAIIETWGLLPRLVDAETMGRILLPWLHTNAFFEKPGAVEQLVDQFLSNPFPPSAETIHDQSLAISRFSSSSRLSKLDCPTLVVVGEEETLFPVEFSRQLVRGIRGAELVVLKKTGHGLLIESPDAVASAMLDFLIKQEA